MAKKAVKPAAKPKAGESAEADQARATDIDGTGDEA
jgi:hypothetical protein